MGRPSAHAVLQYQTPPTLTEARSRAARQIAQDPEEGRRSNPAMASLPCGRVSKAVHHLGIESAYPRPEGHRVRALDSVFSAV